MRELKSISLLLLTLVLSGCGGLESKTILISPGDSKKAVLEIMGIPDDRQFKAYPMYTAEAWQYCVTGAGYGYNAHKIIWLEQGRVTGITSYKSYRTGCTGQIQAVNWHTKPDVVIEKRVR